MKWTKTGSGIAAGLLAATLTSGLAGCAINRQATPAPQTQQVRVQSTTPAAPGTVPIAHPKEVAAHLEQLAKGIRGVKGANCVVFGNYAVVGIDVDSKMDRTRVGAVKYAVAEAFRKDPYGVDAVVTADVDMAQRLREIRTDVMNGRPVSGFAEEMADIVGRLVPQLPRSVVPPASPDGTAGIRQMQRQTTTSGTSHHPAR
ncbi:YhcN/YlaJ family sporulation lipoprotein [Cohnella zeiphila]|uniref:YhcN/YlaJ family sporulation lipoprotein n=1 Tax=Cohnella zeiphila TaxID=2761120 RepID=A0A7X0SGS1_9BACL|nr:YhcN/YlaJ family sporulation lipoprotein [Cohnella zeiphila]MBB6729676.1 YhcN/YlaJ family sporulation lipoprotein [Cohnella zeiphila]